MLVDSCNCGQAVVGSDIVRDSSGRRKWACIKICLEINLLLPDRDEVGRGRGESMGCRMSSRSMWHEQKQS